MGPFRRQALGRTQILEAADRARVARRRRRAISLYRRVLAREPRNAELHARLAPLLAETGQAFDAWTHFRAAARAWQRGGRPDRALALYREAALYLPREYQVWQAIAHLQHQQGECGAAVDSLLEGSRLLRARWSRCQAIYLLRRAREIEPWRFEVVVELAQLLAMAEQRDEARLLLAGLEDRSSRLVQVRAAQLRIDPGPRALWRWLRAALQAPPPRPALRGAVVRPAVVRLRARAG